MRALIVGAGAVGIVLHRALEQQKGSELTFLVRAGRKAQLTRTKILDARTGELHVRERPAVVEQGQPLPAFDTVVFCVRADQLAAAVDGLGPIPPGTRLATITPGPEGLALLRARHPALASVRLGPAFMAYQDGDAIVVWQPPILKTPVSHEDGGTDAAAFAAELATALEAGGVPARARAKMIPGLDSATDALYPLLAAYALAAYDGCALADDRALLALAGDAIAEIITLSGGPGLAAALARRATAPIVRAALINAVPRLPRTFSAMGRAHGPKLDSQTRAALEDLTGRARIEGRDTPALDQLVRRLDARPPVPATPPTPAVTSST